MRHSTNRFTTASPAAAASGPSAPNNAGPETAAVSALAETLHRLRLDGDDRRRARPIQRIVNARAGPVLALMLVIGAALVSAASAPAASPDAASASPADLPFLKSDQFVTMRPLQANVDTSADHVHLPRLTSVFQERRAALGSADLLHPMELAFSVQLFGRTIELQLRKNLDLFGSGYDHFMFHSEPGHENETEAFHATHSTASATQHCHYHGFVKGDAESSVAVSICDGLKGIIKFQGAWYAVEPAAPSNGAAGAGGLVASPMGLYRVGEPLYAEKPADSLRSKDHVVYSLKAAAQESHGTCGVKHDRDRTGEALLNTLLAAAPSKLSEEHAEDSSSSSSAAKLEPQFRAGAPTKFIEVIVFNDFERYRRLGASTETDTAGIMNYIAKFYADSAFHVNFVVSLASQVTFNRGDPFAGVNYGGMIETQGPSGLLTQFQRYLSGAARSLPRHNNAQLFSGSQFKDGIVGLAGVGTFCAGPLSAAVCMLKRGSQPLNALVCAHEMGHNLGMEHDSMGNQCQGGYIMAPYESAATIFSPCSISYTQRYFMSQNPVCMDTPPTPKSRPITLSEPSDDKSASELREQTRDAIPNWGWMLVGASAAVGILGFAVTAVWMVRRQCDSTKATAVSAGTTVVKLPAPMSAPIQVAVTQPNGNVPVAPAPAEAV